MGLELGSAEMDGSGYRPLEGDQLLVPGSQGGFHVWLKYRLSGMSPGKIKVKRTARRVSDNRLLLVTDWITQEVGPAGADGFWELPQPIPSFMCPTPIGVAVENNAAVFDVVIATPDGQVLVEKTGEAVPRCPQGDQAEFCHRICNG